MSKRGQKQYIVAAHALDYRAGARLDPHAHETGQLLMMTQGVLQVTLPEGRWLVPSQRAVWIPPHFSHSVDVLASVEMRTLYFSRAWLEKHSPNRLRKPFVVRVDPLLREAVLGLFIRKDEEVRTSALASVIMCELPEAVDRATFFPMPRDRRARRAAEAVLGDISNNLSLDHIAQKVGSTRRTLTRLFTSETGYPFRIWRQRARMMLAIELLGSKRLSVKQISLKLGFTSTSAFIHAFKQVLGVTPGVFMTGDED